MATASYSPTASPGQPYGPGTVPKRGDSSIDERVKAHMRKLVQTRFKSLYALAKKIQTDPSTLYKIFSDERGVGIDVVHRMHRHLGISADVFLDDDPEARYWIPGPDEGRRGRRPGNESAPPSGASPSAQPGRSERNGAAHPRDLNARSAPMVSEPGAPHYGATPKKARRS